MLGPQHWLAALAMLFVLFAPYQTLVQTVIIDDEIRLGVEADSYDMVWVNKSTGAQFALMPRNVVSGEFTHVVQRVPVRIQIERDDRWQQLRAGLSGTVGIAHGPGDAAWAADAYRAMKELEMQYNSTEKPEDTTTDGNSSTAAARP
jgi:membrane fusion protein (multidrug efflux system)